MFRGLQVIRGVFTNPILLLTVAGIIGSFTFGGQLPEIASTFLKTLGSAFSATALFLLGLRMVNKMEHFKGSKIIAPLVLVALKLIAMPIIAREVVRLISRRFAVSSTSYLFNLLNMKRKELSWVLIEQCLYAKQKSYRGELMYICPLGINPIFPQVHKNCPVKN
jgi:predicted permease